MRNNRLGVALAVLFLLAGGIGVWAISKSPSTPTYGGGVGHATTTTSPASTTTPTTTTTLLTSGPKGPNGIGVKGSVSWTAAQWVTNYYSEFYKWPNLLYGPNVLAKPFETPQFAAYNLTHNGNLTSPGSKNAWTLIKVGKTGIYPVVTAADVPLGSGTCLIQCVVNVVWTNGTFDSTGGHVAPAPGTPSNNVIVILTKTHGTWLVSANPTSVGN